MNIFMVRRIVSLTLLVAWIATALTGIVLYMGSSELFYKIVRGVSLRTVAELHTYFSFIALGVSIIHIYLNRHSIAAYLGLRKKNKR
ncbi:DUF4405 domain-containing protein [Desulfurococcaceae archaeon MEX13E-LK6-19]|nr:DUF4405 domain-containing protein [Desulfurococcaceae archaeon MEX13E-LK6-19]